jgi:hypothetical protein
MIEYQFFLDYGAMGLFLGWFMFRMEKVIKNNTEVLILVKDKVANDRK